MILLLVGGRWTCESAAGDPSNGLPVWAKQRPSDGASGQLLVEISLPDELRSVYWPIEGEGESGLDSGTLGPYFSVASCPVATSTVPTGTYL